MKGIFTLRRSQRPAPAPTAPLTPPPSCPTSPFVDSDASPACIRGTTGPTQLRSVLPAKKHSGDSLGRRSKSRSASAELGVDFGKGETCFTPSAAPSPAPSYSSHMTQDTVKPSPSPSPQMCSTATMISAALLDSPELVSTLPPLAPQAPLPPLPLSIPIRLSPRPSELDLGLGLGASLCSSTGSSFAGDRTPISPAFYFGNARRASASSFSQAMLGDDDVAPLALDRRTSADGLDVFGLSLSAADDAPPSCPPSPLPYHLRSHRPGSPLQRASRMQGKALPPRRRSSSSLNSSLGSMPPVIRVPHSPARITFTSPFQTHASTSPLSTSPMALLAPIAPTSPYEVPPHRTASIPLPPPAGLPPALRGSRIKARSLAPLDIASPRRRSSQAEREMRRSVRFA